MRIIAGEKRGMKLLSPKTMDSRPIIDRVKESLFNIFANRYSLPEGAKVADVFSGVGSLGLEALSRGASHVTFVERDRGTLEMLKKNITKGWFEDRSHVVRTDAYRSGAVSCSGVTRYDLIMIDPPYPTTRDTGPDSPIGKLLHIVEGQLEENGLVTVRTHVLNELLDVYGNLKVIDRRTWAKMTITFLKREGDDE